MSVSVVIPVFNAEAYVEQAVASALDQSETREVILVEDGSTDSSLSVCRRLAARSNQIRLLRHPHGLNLGAGASRNLGIAHAQFPLIAFLDADDYFLPGRFEIALGVLAFHADADGVYEDIGCFYQDEASRTRFRKSEWPERMGMRRPVAPDQLFDALAAGGAGSFCTDGVLVRRSLFERSGLFNPDLRTGQDTHLWVRMAAVGRLYPGRTDRPVGMCRIHVENRVTGRAREGRQEDVGQVWGDLVRWGRASALPAPRMRLLARRYVVASRGLISQRSLFGASRVAWQSCGFLIRHCPQPWRVEGFASLLESCSVVGLAGRRLADYVIRASRRRGEAAA